LYARRWVRDCMIVAALVAASVPAGAQDADEGKTQFLAHCAGCHGADAKGDGPQGVSLTIKPADLTLLAKHNNGVFAPGLVYQIIDGRHVQVNHRDAEMPVWGCRHQEPTVASPPPAMTWPHSHNHTRRPRPVKPNGAPTLESLLDLPCESDAAIQNRILSIVGYLSLIQER